MLRVLADVVAALAAALVLLIPLLIGVRAVALRRIRPREQFRPAAEAALGQYLAGTAAAPELASRGDRNIFLAIAAEALAGTAAGRGPGEAAPAGTQSPAQLGR